LKQKKLVKVHFCSDNNPERKYTLAKNNPITSSKSQRIKSGLALSKKNTKLSTATFQREFLLKAQSVIFIVASDFCLSFSYIKKFSIIFSSKSLSGFYLLLLLSGLLFIYFSSSKFKSFVSLTSWSFSFKFCDKLLLFKVFLGI